MKTKLDENALVQLVLDGQVNEFQEIIVRYQKLVWHLVAKIVKSEADREDVCQDVFVKVYKNLRSFKFESKLSTWIGRIAYTSAINFIQKKRPELYEDIAPEGVTLDSVAGNEMNPEQHAGRENVNSILRKEIMNLPIQYKTIVTLYHLDEMNYSEIANVTKLPIGTVKSHLFRARKLLKDRLEMRYTKEDLCQ